MLTDNCYTYISSCACVCARGRVYVWDQRVKIYPNKKKKKKKGTWKNSIKAHLWEIRSFEICSTSCTQEEKRKEAVKTFISPPNAAINKTFLDLFYRLKFLQLPTYLQPWISSGLSWESKQRRQNLKMSKARGELCNRNNIPFFWREELSQSRKAENSKAKYVREEWGAGEKTEQILMSAVQLLVAHWKSKISNNTEFDVCEYKYKRVQMELGNWMTGEWGWVISLSTLCKVTERWKDRWENAVAVAAE